MWRAQRLAFSRSARGITLLQSCTGAEEVAGDLEGILGRFDYYPVHSCQPTNIILNTSKLIPLLTDEVEKLVFCSFPQLKVMRCFSLHL